MRNYHTLTAPKVYLALLPADRCGDDFVVEGPDHPHMVLDPAPSLALMESVMTYREGMDDKDGLSAIIQQSLYQIALVVTGLGGDWALHPTRRHHEWPDDVEARIAVLRKLTREDYAALQAGVAYVSGLSEDEAKNSHGG